MADKQILNSWKEISNYVGRGVRTVQRWEQLYGLPVHRAAGKDRSAVYALSEEIDAWLRAGKTHELAVSNGAKRYSELMKRVDALDADARRLLDEAAALRKDIEDTALLMFEQQGSRLRKMAPQRLQEATKKSA